MNNLNPCRRGSNWQHSLKKKKKRIPASKESGAIIIIWGDLGDSSKSHRARIFKFISSITRARNCLLLKKMNAELSNTHVRRLGEKAWCLWFSVQGLGTATVPQHSSGTATHRDRAELQCAVGRAHCWARCWQISHRDEF